MTIAMLLTVFYWSCSDEEKSSSQATVPSAGAETVDEDDDESGIPGKVRKAWRKLDTLHLTTSSFILEGQFEATKGSSSDASGSAQAVIKDDESIISVLL